MQSELIIGVDVAKAEIVGAIDGVDREFRVANQDAALSAWLETVPAGSRLAVEATGGYHQRLVGLAHARGLTVFVLNPKDVYHYARAVGLRAKTDRVDARLIARYAAHEHARLRPYAPAMAAQQCIHTLLARRATLVRARQMMHMSLSEIKSLQTRTRKALRDIDQLLKRIDALIKAAQKAAGQSASVKRLRSLPGIGKLNAAALANLLARIPFRRSDALIAWVGLDPRPADSGHKTGRRRLSKRGDSELRRLIYNAASAALRNPDVRAIYDHWRQKGLSSTAAIIVIARKLLRMAFALYKHQTQFDSGYLKKPA